MVLIQLLLPIVQGTGSDGPMTPIAKTREELAAQFKGLTAYLRSPAKGVWTASDGHTEQDDVVMVEVVTDRFDRDWWRSYTTMLSKRFRQDAIHVRALPIQALEENEDI